MPPPEMSPRVLVAAVPARRLASCILTVSCNRLLSPVQLKIRPAISISPLRSCAAENSGSLTGERSASGIGCSAFGFGAAMLGGMPDDHDSTFGPGNRAGDDDCIILGQHLQHLQVGHRHRFIAHLTRHPQALEHAARKRAVADRTAMAEVFVVTLRPGEAAEMVAFDDPGVATPLG